MSNPNDMVQTSSGVYAPQHAVQNINPQTSQYTVTQPQHNYNINGEGGKMILAAKSAAMIEALDVKSSLEYADLVFKHETLNYLRSKNLITENTPFEDAKKTLSKEKIEGFSDFVKETVYKITEDALASYGFRLDENVPEIRKTRTLDILSQVFLGLSPTYIYTAALKGPRKALEAFDELKRRAVDQAALRAFESNLSALEPETHRQLAAASEYYGVEIRSKEELDERIRAEISGELFAVTDIDASKRTYERNLKDLGYYERFFLNKNSQLEQIISTKPEDETLENTVEQQAA